MAESITFNNAVYVIPDVGESNWGQNLTNYFVAIPQGAYQLSGGTNPLTADLSFGTNFGLFSKYLTSVTSTPATAGMIRLAKTDSIAWRNNANSANLLLAIDSSNNLTYNGSVIPNFGIPIPIADGGTNSTTALSNSRLMVSKTGAIIEADGSNYSMNSGKITSLAAGTTNGDSVRYEQVIGQYLLLAGGTMSGAIAMGTNNITGINLGQAVSFRATGAVVGASGSSLELLFSAGTGIVQVYDRTGGAYLPLQILGSTLLASYDGGAHAMISGSSAGVSVLGTNTNDSAAAGFVGEYIVSTASSVSAPTTNQWGDLTSISLTAGDWDVTFVCYTNLNGATETQCNAGIGTSAGNTATGLVAGDTLIQFLPPNSVCDTGVTVGASRHNLNTTTTIYAKIQSIYSAGTPKYFGRLSARRMR